jgi:nucleoside 2-deoxyribosyltransferase
MSNPTKKIKVYLSGPMEYAPDGGEGWRETAEKTLGDSFNIFNPCKSSVEILERNRISSVQEYNHLKKTIQFDTNAYHKYLNTTKQFFNLDIDELSSSDIVLAQVNELASGGTSGELTLACAIYKIPIIGFCDGDISKISGWTLSCIDYFFFRTEWNTTAPLIDAIAAVKILSKTLSHR